MKRIGIVLTIGVFLMAASLLPAARQAAAEVTVDVGDFWTYEAGGELEGMEATIKMKMKVTDTEGSGADEVFVIDISGSGGVSGSSGGITISGDVEYSGEMKRLTSNLSLVYSSLDMVISMSAMGQKVKMTMGTEQTYEPALDDYIGDDLPDYGETLVCHSEVTMTTTLKMEMAGQVISDDSETMTESVVQTITMASANESVEVPAGTFDCMKYTYSLYMGGMTETLTYYYSDKAGNFVKSEGTMSMTGALGDSELKAYSHAGNSAGTTSSLFSGTNMLIIIVVIVAIIVVVALVVMMRKRGRAATPMPPPVTETAPPPPPPPGA